jgi:predicted nucleic acid-binding Zn ribbon protein
MNRKDDAKSLKKVIDDLMRIYGLEDRLFEAKMGEVWASVVGPFSAKHTTSVRFKSGVLYVEMDSAVLKEEYSHQKELLIRMLNDEVGKKAVEAIEIR